MNGEKQETASVSTGDTKCACATAIGTIISSFGPILTGIAAIIVACSVKEPAEKYIDKCININSNQNENTNKNNFFFDFAKAQSELTNLAKENPADLKSEFESRVPTSILKAKERDTALFITPAFRQDAMSEAASAKTADQRQEVFTEYYRKSLEQELRKKIEEFKKKNKK